MKQKAPGRTQVVSGARAAAPAPEVEAQPYGNAFAAAGVDRSASPYGVAEGALAATGLGRSPYDAGRDVLEDQPWWAGDDSQYPGLDLVREADDDVQLDPVETETGAMLVPPLPLPEFLAVVSDVERWLAAQGGPVESETTLAVFAALYGYAGGLWWAMIPGAQGESLVPTADDVPSLATLFVGEGTERPIQLDNGELVDVGHVFPGIQAIQDPVTPLLGVGIHNDDGATWSGDVGQAMVAAEEDPSLSVDEAMQQCAPTEDLNGDLDGIALGSTWDPSKSLSEQLGEYYQNGGVDQRFTQFCATEGLEVGPDGALTEDARAIVADEVDDFAELFRFRDGLPENGLWPNQFDPTSPESLAFTDRFVAYLEQGLARERAASAA